MEAVVVGFVTGVDVQVDAEGFVEGFVGLFLCFVDFEAAVGDGFGLESLDEALFDEGLVELAVDDDEGGMVGFGGAEGESAVVVFLECGVEDDVVAASHHGPGEVDHFFVGFVDVFWCVEAGVEAVVVAFEGVDAGKFLADDVGVEGDGVVVDGEFFGDGGFSCSGESGDDEHEGLCVVEFEVEE